MSRIRTQHTITEWARTTDGVLADQVRTYLADGMDPADAVTAARLILDINPTDNKTTGIPIDLKELIVLMRIAGIGPTEICKITGVARNTPANLFNAYARTRSKRKIEHELGEQLVRVEHVTNEALRLAALAELSDLEADHTAIPKYLALILKAGERLEKLTGTAAATKVEHTGADGGPIQIEDPKMALMGLLDRLAPAPDEPVPPISTIDPPVE